MNSTLLYYECRLSGGDTKTLPALIKFVITGGGDAKHRLVPTHAFVCQSMPEPPSETFTT